MIALTLLLIATPQAPATLETPVTLFTRMFARYANAQSLSSNIHMTQTAMNKTLTFDSVLSYQRPDKIFFVQKKSNDGSYAPKLASNGIEFVYSHVVKDNRMVLLKETCHPNEGSLNTGEMWGCVGEAISKGDDSFMVEAMVSRPLSLKVIRDQLVSFSNKGLVKYGNQMVNDIEGRWRLTGMGQEGTFTMYISNEGDLVYHQTNMTYAVDTQWLKNHHLPLNAYPDGVSVVTTWEANTKIDQPVDQAMFKLPN